LATRGLSISLPLVVSLSEKKKEKKDQKISKSEEEENNTISKKIKKVTNLIYAGTMAASMAEATPQRFTASEPSSVSRVLFCGSSGWGTKVVVSSVRTCCLKLLGKVKTIKTMCETLARRSFVCCEV